jgi:hypothetical protein
MCPEKGDFSMRRLLIALTLTLLTTAAYGGHHGNWNIGDGDECSSRHFQFNDRRAFVAEETIEAGNLASLKVAVENSPVTVMGGSSHGYSITVCKAAESADLLDDIHVTVSGGELRATGPDHRDWLVAYRILVPDRANVEVETRNGPVAFRGLNGTVVARLSNGPVSLDDVDGDVDVVTKNGPVSIEGGSGNIKLRATNGPLSVDLDGRSFDGSLDAATQNGPLTVRVPAGYGSRVVVETRGRGPVSCHADECANARGSWWDDDDRPRRLEFGKGVENVHISTVNGPVTIRQD